MVVARIRLNKINADAYAQCFEAIFQQVSEDYPTFKVGQTLTGIIADWSDQQVNGLIKTVGKKHCKQCFKRLSSKCAAQYPSTKITSSHVGPFYLIS